MEIRPIRNNLHDAFSFRVSQQSGPLLESYEQQMESAADQIRPHFVLT